MDAPIGLPDFYIDVPHDEVHGFHSLYHGVVGLFIGIGKPVAEGLAAEIFLLARGESIGLIPIVEQGVLTGLYHSVADEGDVQPLETAHICKVKNRIVVQRNILLAEK